MTTVSIRVNVSRSGARAKPDRTAQRRGGPLPPEHGHPMQANLRGDDVSIELLILGRDVEKPGIEIGRRERAAAPLPGLIVGPGQLDSRWQWGAIGRRTARRQAHGGALTGRFGSSKLGAGARPGLSILASLDRTTARLVNVASAGSAPPRASPEERDPRDRLGREGAIPLTSTLAPGSIAVDPHRPPRRPPNSRATSLSVVGAGKASAPTTSTSAWAWRADVAGLASEAAGSRRTDRRGGGPGDRQRFAGRVGAGC